MNSQVNKEICINSLMHFMTFFTREKIVYWFDYTICCELAVNIIFMAQLLKIGDDLRKLYHQLLNLVLDHKCLQQEYKSD